MKIVYWIGGIILAGIGGYFGYKKIKGSSTTGGSNDSTSTDSGERTNQTYDVEYVAPKNESGKITDSSIMEIRLKNGEYDIKEGDMVELTGSNGDDGAYPITSIIKGNQPIAMWLMVSHTTTAPASGRNTLGAKAKIVPALFATGSRYNYGGAMNVTGNITNIKSIQIYNVLYVAPRNANGIIIDSGVMEIRFTVNNANVKTRK